MVHGIYFRSRPKNKWQLVSVTASPEAAQQDVNDMITQAHKEGNEEAEAVSQIFDSAFWIPHYLDEVKVQKSMYN